MVILLAGPVTFVVSNDEFLLVMHGPRIAETRARLTGPIRALPMLTGSYPVSNGLAEHAGSILPP